MTEIKGDAHIHHLPNALNVRRGTVAECDCGERFVSVPQGIFSAGWEAAPNLKTEEEVNGENTTDSDSETVEEGQTAAETDPVGTTDSD